MCLTEEKGADITFDEQYWNTRKCYLQEIAKSGDLSRSLVKTSPFIDHTVVVADIIFSGVFMSELCWTVRLSRPGRVAKKKRRSLPCLVVEEDSSASEVM